MYMITHSPGWEQAPQWQVNRVSWTQDSPRSEAMQQSKCCPHDSQMSRIILVLQKRPVRLNHYLNVRSQYITGKQWSTYNKLHWLYILVLRRRYRCKNCIPTRNSKVTYELWKNKSIRGSVWYITRYITSTCYSNILFLLTDMMLTAMNKAHVQEPSSGFNDEN